MLVLNLTLPAQPFPCSFLFFSPCFFLWSLLFTAISDRTSKYALPQLKGLSRILRQQVSKPIWKGARANLRSVLIWHMRFQHALVSCAHYVLRRARNFKKWDLCVYWSNRLEKLEPTIPTLIPAGGKELYLMVSIISSRNFPETNVCGSSMEALQVVQGRNKDTPA